jgi:hypothetical protein
MLNAAAWVAFWVWLSGKAVRSWHKVQYEFGPQALRPALRSPVNVHS